MWIAASALEHGLVLLTRDAHFGKIDGLLTAASVDQLLP
jgi:predicted nucleic acid-binding protein